MAALTAELVRRQVRVIFAAGGAAPIVAKAATTTIPIVFSYGGEPVRGGLVPNLNHPGGNVTGAFFPNVTLIAKRLELLHEIAPAATLIGFLVNPTGAEYEAQIAEAEKAAHILGVRLLMLKASTPSEIEAAFTALADQRTRALLPAGDPLFPRQASQLVTLAAHQAVAMMYTQGSTVEAGGLISYGARDEGPAAQRIGGTYVGRILKGEKPGDLPVQQSTRIELVINLQTAKALGLEVPPQLLARADEVIE